MSSTRQVGSSTPGASSGAARYRGWALHAGPSGPATTALQSGQRHASYHAPSSVMSAARDRMPRSPRRARLRAPRHYRIPATRRPSASTTSSRTTASAPQPNSTTLPSATALFGSTYRWSPARMRGAMLSSAARTVKVFAPHIAQSPRVPGAQPDAAGEGAPAPSAPSAPHNRRPANVACEPPPLSPKRAPIASTAWPAAVRPKRTSHAREQQSFPPAIDPMRSWRVGKRVPLSAPKPVIVIVPVLAFTNCPSAAPQLRTPEVRPVPPAVRSLR